MENEGVTGYQCCSKYLGSQIEWGYKRKYAKHHPIRFDLAPVSWTPYVQRTLFSNVVGVMYPNVE